jgi:hypothetical protein
VGVVHHRPGVAQSHDRRLPADLPGRSLDGTNYEDAPSSTNPGSHQLVATVSLTVSTSVKKSDYRTVPAPGGKMKWVLKNSSGVAFAASANTAKLFTCNEQGV